MLRFEDVARDQDAPFFAVFMDAWSRALPGLPCPLKLQDGDLYFRILGDGSSELWQHKTDAGPLSSMARRPTRRGGQRICHR